jgi:hypothetical protein
MMPSTMRFRRLRLMAAWVALFSFFNASTLAAEDECERINSDGQTRDCTFLEEMRECIDDANDSLDECVEDAKSQDNWWSIGSNWVGCQLAFEVNMSACAVSVSVDWAFGEDF